MSSIKDFDALFASAPVVTTLPHVSLDGFTFRLLGFGPYREWENRGTAEAPNWAQKQDLIFDDSGERVRCETKLQLVTPDGVQTSASSPFVDNRHYFDVDGVKALVGAVGKTVVLVNPRIEFRESVSKENKKGFRRVETRMMFAFDDMKAGE